MYAIDAIRQTRASTLLRRAVERLTAGTLTIHMACGVHLLKAFALFTAGPKTTGNVGMQALMTLWVPTIPGVLSHETSLGIVCVAVSVLALWAIHMQRLSHWGVALALLPQQCLLLVTAMGAAEAVWHGQYADGYVPFGGGWFIFTDQLQRILLAPCYTIAVFTCAMRHEHRIYWR